MSNILIGVTGGIAAYKIPELVRLFIKDGNTVKVVLTKNSELFITRETLEVLTGNRVYSDNLPDNDIINAKHIELAKWADVVLIVPATFNTIGKMASGVADNLLTNIVATIRKDKIIISPSMNVNMWNNRILQENLQKLVSFGIDEIEPEEGYLACGDTGKGRLPDIDVIFAKVKRHIEKDDWFVGKRYIVTAGGTEENIDAVRVISNRSSGKMGIELAKQLYFKGAEVLLVVGRTTVDVPKYIKFIKSVTTESMLGTISSNIKNDTRLIMSAAVSDFVVNNRGTQKFHRDEINNLELKENIDIIKSIRSEYSIPIIGFALENGMDLGAAKRKLEEKGLNAIILNDVSAIGSDISTIKIIKSGGEISEELSGSKEKLAAQIVDRLKNI